MSNENRLPAYVIVNLDVSDAERFQAYQAKVKSTLQPFAGKPVAMSKKPAVLEGDWQNGLSLILQFPSHEAAQGWYDSEANQAVVPLRQAATTANQLLIVDGV